MNTLLLRLAGPLQAWGSTGKFNTRYTDREPTKSGVIGMIASSMGRSRDESIEDLNSLRFGVRVDQEGEFLKDLQTVHRIEEKPSGKDEESVYKTDRHYLCDAIFIVGLEGRDELLRNIESSLKDPVYPLFLGRRACPPTMPITLGIRNASLCDALRNEPWMSTERYQKRVSRVRVIYDATKTDIADATTRDRPISYSQSHRKHGLRSVTFDTIRFAGNHSHEEMVEENSTDHDVFSEIEKFNEEG